MSSKSSFYDLNFWGIIVILLLTVHVSIAIYLGRININFIFLSVRFPHLLGIIGASFIVLFTPIFYLLKKIAPRQYRTILKLHMFGNTISFFLVSMHVEFWIIRLPLGVGLLLFIFMLILVLTGFSYRFNLLKPLRIYVKDIPHYNRYLHTSLTVSFYLIFLFHLINVLDFTIF